MRDKTGNFEGNPYHATLLEAAGVVLTKSLENILENHTTAGKIRWEARSEWNNASVATCLLIGAYAYASPGSPHTGSKAILSWAEKAFAHLLETSHDGRWFHLESGMGDRNVDRFTLIPFIESLRLMEADLPKELTVRAYARLGEIFDVQYREYGHAVDRRIYPNMDSYYCLAMYYAAEFTAEQRYWDEFERTLQRLDVAQYADGGWAYIDSMNESPNYHRVTAVVMARIADLSGHPLAMEQIRRSVPYYPKSLCADLNEEYHTNCWWKHAWQRGEVLSWTPDIKASLTGDGVNRWIGDQCRESTNRALIDGLEKFDNSKRLAAVYAALLWQPVTPVPRATPGIIFDHSINGPRGHSKHWSWAATARNGCDTVVGARMNDPQALVALMGIMPEIPVIPEMDVMANDLRNRWSKGTMPPQTVGFAEVDANSARYRVSYRMAPYATNPAKPDPLPRHWLCHQEWDLAENELSGSIRITCLQDHSSAPPIVRIRLGFDAEVEQLDAATFKFGKLRIRVVDGDSFGHRNVIPARTTHSIKEPNAVELVLRTEPTVAESQHQQGQTFSLGLKVTCDENDG